MLFLDKLILRNLKIRKKSLFLQFQKLKNNVFIRTGNHQKREITETDQIGINAFPTDEYKITDTTKSIKNNFTEGKSVKILGRLMSRRIQGRLLFAELQDSEGRIQVYFNRDEICTGEDKTLYNEVYKHLLDIGDIIGVEGELFKTQVGEMTVMVKKLYALTKALRPLPQPRTDENGVVP